MKCCNHQQNATDLINRFGNNKIHENITRMKTFS